MNKRVVSVRAHAHPYGIIFSFSIIVCVYEHVHTAPCTRERAQKRVRTWALFAQLHTCCVQLFNDICTCAKKSVAPMLMNVYAAKWARTSCTPHCLHSRRTPDMNTFCLWVCAVVCDIRDVHLCAHTHAHTHSNNPSLCNCNFILSISATLNARVRVRMAVAGFVRPGRIMPRGEITRLITSCARHGRYDRPCRRCALVGQLLIGGLGPHTRAPTHTPSTLCKIVYDCLYVLVGRVLLLFATLLRAKSRTRFNLSSASVSLFCSLR
jgi:hypothetical protein